MVLMMAMISRRSPAAGLRVARMRLHSSSIATSMPLTFRSSVARDSPKELSPSTSAVIALARLSSTRPPIASTRVRTRSRSSLNRREMWWERSAVSIHVLRCAGQCIAAAIDQHASRWEYATESAAASRFAVHFQRSAMVLQYMLHNGKTEPGAAGRAGPARVHPVESFGQPRQVLGRNPGSRVMHLETALALLIQAPADAHLAGGRCVLGGVVHQVREAGVQLDL